MSEVPKRKSMLTFGLLASVPIGGLVLVSIPAVAIGVAVVGVSAVVGSNARIRKFRGEADRANTAMADGDFATAAEIYRAWSSSRIPLIAAASRHQLAWSQMRRGDPKSAIAIALDNDDKSRWQLERLHLVASSAVNLALYHALAGELAAARDWLSSAQVRAKGTSSMPSAATMIAFARAVIDCRAGQADDVVRDLGDHAAEYDEVPVESAWRRSTARALRVVHAFAISVVDPRDIGRAQKLLADHRKTRADEFDFLGAAWPEMAAFVATIE